MINIVPSIFATLSTLVILMPTRMQAQIQPEKVLASHEFSLEQRYYPIQKDNILLNLAYMNGNVHSASDINWSEVEKPQHYQFVLDPNQTFAFHDDTLSQYSNVVKTTNAHFNAQEGFRNAGYMYGDGVCHLASLIYWTALDAGLDTQAPTNHNFMAIPQIDRKYGVSIYSNPLAKGQNAKQNLYITNNKSNPVEFNFDYDGDNLKVTVVEN